MNNLLLLGEPIFLARPIETNHLVFPFGQEMLCAMVRSEVNYVEDLIQKLTREYIAVAYALHQMGLNFSIIRSRNLQFGSKILFFLKETLGCKLAGFSDDIPLSITGFPCDFGLELTNLYLINTEIGCTKKTINNKKVVVSDYGQAGRILARDSIAFVAKEICCGGHTKPPQVQELRQSGIKVGILPSITMLERKLVEKLARQGINDHLDRVAALVEDRQGNLHLIVDPQYYSGVGDNIKKPQETIKEIKEICGGFGVKVHIPETLTIPYSLNLVQFPDGRVLMTSGDDQVAAIIESLIGSDNIFLTEIPIKYYPVFLRGGIRCLIGLVPKEMFK